MFEKIIGSTQFSGDLANNMFRHISGDGYMGDVSLISTARALLWQRIPRQNHLTLSTEEYTISDNPPDFSAFSFHPDHLYVIAINSDPLLPDPSAVHSLFDSFSMPDRFQEYPDVSQFFASVMRCRAFVDEASHTSVICVCDMNIRRYHLLQCILPKLLPWVFDRVRLTQTEKSLLLSLKEKRSAAYEEALSILADTQEYRSLHATAQMTLLRRNINEKKRRNIEQKIENTRQEVEIALNRLADLNNRINNDNLTLCGILNAISADDSSADNEISDFVSANPNISILETRDSSIVLSVKGYLDIFDADNYQSIMGTQHSFYLNSLENAMYPAVFQDKQARKRLLDSVFGDSPRFKLRTCAIFEIDLGVCRVHPVRNSTLYQGELSHYYPNPHLYHNACMGSYASVVYQKIAAGDITGTFSQCIMSTHTVNVAERASFHYVVEEIFHPDKKYFEDSEGNTYTASEAYDLLTQGDVTNASV